MKQDKKWWKNYWKEQKEMTKRDLEAKRMVDEEERQYAKNHFGPVETIATPGYLEWNGQHEGHNY